MKKALLVIGVVLALFAVGGVVWVVNAQTDTPETPDQNFDCPMWDNEDGNGWSGHMGRGGMMGRSFDENGEFGCGVNGEYGPMHETIVNALAEATGLSVDEINTKMSEGETMYQIASDAGLSEEQINDLFTQAHQDAFETLGEDNGFFQEHLDRMKQMWNGEFTPGFGRGGRSGQGGCQGGNFEGARGGMMGGRF
jgi:hypothetical protein